MKRYDDQLAVVTGATSGLGRRFALDLADRGARVIGVGRDPDRLAALDDALAGRGQIRRCDVADDEALTALLATTQADLGPIDVLIQSAGIEERSGIGELDLARYDRVQAVNARAPVVGMLAVVPAMVRRGRGVVVNVSSDHGRAPAPGSPAYSASKASLSAFTEAVAHEVRPAGVAVHVLYPGWVPTPLGAGAVEAGMPTPPRAVRRTEEQVSSFLLERMGGRAIDLNAARVAALAPVARALVPPLYRRQMAAQVG